MTASPPARPLRALAARLRGCTAGLAATEFALTFPIILALGLTGLELCNRTIVTMQVNQLAVQLADNASRIGDESMLQDRRIYESDIQDLFYGAELQAGPSLNLYGQGRVILSSLEVVPGTNNQYIHWQRCMGALRSNSTYGNEGDGRNGGFPGMGPPGEEVLAFPDEAVMFVELHYEYKPIIGNPFGSPSQIHSRASFTVRDDRDLSQIYQKDASNPATVASCGSYGTTSYSDPLPAGSSSSSTSSTSSTSTTSGGTSASSTTTGGTTTTGSSTTTGGTSTTSGSSTTTSGGSSTSGGTTCTFLMRLLFLC
ncbi:TadE/TadG family type IV pilus assembly protein [Alteraurantiacibacter buctensis]|uniref:Pilus assembly protein n=1 Tax=Alteraurantiacibacter buctensis TaxID=1503981 RepID=A0A844YYW3_9SPHN|nr:hypothetical protein [Alteraurantiacibacter buctensis]MXO72238.1 hypothetical protein [Alteraurantiacibacter buctensis]